jgi:BlaI family penicillinase repressor
MTAPHHHPALTPFVVFQFAGSLQKFVMVTLLVAIIAAIVVLALKLREGRRLTGGSAFLSGLRIGGPIIGLLGACRGQPSDRADPEDAGARHRRVVPHGWTGLLRRRGGGRRQLGGGLADRPAGAGRLNAMTSIVHVTEAESEVLAALWRHGPLPPSRLVEAVKTRRDWGEATIKTLLGRLMHKKAVKSVREDGALRYRVLIGRADYVDGEVGALVDRLFGGDEAALITLLSERRGKALN